MTPSFHHLIFPIFAVVCAESATVKFDINSGDSPTLPGWVGVNSRTGIGKNKNYTLTLSPIVRNFNRDRGIAKTPQGKDNDDNAVPQGKHSAMYRDFMFILPGKFTGTISGLAPGTTYPVTVFSWDSAQGETNEVDWGAKNKTTNRLTYTGDLATNSAQSLDPDTSKITDYRVTFQVTADASGNLTFEGISANKSSVISLNGVIVGDPIPTSAPAIK